MNKLHMFTYLNVLILYTIFRIKLSIKKMTTYLVYFIVLKMKIPFTTISYVLMYAFISLPIKYFL